MDKDGSGRVVAVVPGIPVALARPGNGLLNYSPTLRYGPCELPLREMGGMPVRTSKTETRESRMQSVLEKPPAARPAPPTVAMLPVYLRSTAGPSAAYLTAKRLLDITVALTALVVLSPLFLIVALCVKLTDGGPVFFRQKRVGLNGMVFDFFKFRSMCVDAEARKAELLRLNKHGNSITFKMLRDPRVTWVGRILRKTSIDEAPQLWNVLIGEMTLVGPRPAVVAEVQRYTPRERRRLAVVPGLTCIWQVSGRADLDFQQQVELDCRYIRERSMWLDLKLMVLTIPAVLSGKGAY
jgi:lipopolysaccharide/colanic/teichoic acid biosynthesis glycosyltransferase